MNLILEIYMNIAIKTKKLPKHAVYHPRIAFIIKDIEIERSINIKVTINMLY